VIFVALATKSHEYTYLIIFKCASTQSHSQPNGADSVSLSDLLLLARQSHFFHVHASQYWHCPRLVDEVSQYKSAAAALTLQMWDTVHAPPTAVDSAGPLEDPALTYTSGALDLSRRLAHLEEDPLNTLETFPLLDSHLRMATLNFNELDKGKHFILLRYIEVKNVDVPDSRIRASTNKGPK